MFFNEHRDVQAIGPLEVVNKKAKTPAKPCRCFD